MKIKVNMKFKKADILKHDPKKSLYTQYQEAGCKSMAIPGKIGAGSKVHKFTIEYIDTDDGIGICDTYSLCGSAKWNSYISPIFDTDFEVNCKRCQS